MPHPKAPPAPPRRIPKAPPAPPAPSRLAAQAQAPEKPKRVGYLTDLRRKLAHAIEHKLPADVILDLQTRMEAQLQYRRDYYKSRYLPARGSR